MLDILKSTWILFMILGVFLAFGIAGFYVDKNTDILELERKKKILKEKSMDVELLKSQIKDKTLSLGGTMGIGDSSSHPENKDNTNEDLGVPLNLDSH